MNPLDLIGYVLGGISLVGVVVLGIQGKYRSVTTDVWKDQAEAFKSEADRLTIDNKALKLEADTNKSKADYLQEAYNGRADFKVLSEQMAKQHTEVVKQLSNVAIELGKLTKAIIKKET